MTIFVTIPASTILLLLVVTLCWLVNPSQAFLPTKTEVKPFNNKPTSTYYYDTGRQQQQQQLSPLLLEASIDYAASEAPIQDYDEEDDDDEEDDEETYRINIELSRLASLCAARHNNNGRNNNNNNKDNNDFIPSTSLFSMLSAYATTV